MGEPQPSPVARWRGRSASTIALGLTLGLVLMAGASATAWADPAAPKATDGAPVATLGEAMTGHVAGVRADVVGGFDGDGASATIKMVLTVENDTGRPLPLQITRGALLATDEPVNQTMVIGGTEGEVASATATAPTVLAATGRSTYSLRAFCAQEHDFGPAGQVPMTYQGRALDPLPRVLDTIARADVSEELAQKAVWWVTDDAVAPMTDRPLAKLLAGVDTTAFAHAPVKVVPDARYVPGWGRESDAAGGQVPNVVPGGDRTGGGGGALLFVMLLIVVAVVAILGVAIVRSRTPAPAVVAANRPAGWYPDPSTVGGIRWWDGARWSSHTRR